MLQLLNNLAVNSKSNFYLTSAQTIRFYLGLIKSYQTLCEFWLQGFCLSGQNLSGANFSSYYQDWQNLKGTDFSGCNLKNSTFRKVVGGFSLVRPLIILVTFSLALLLSINSSISLNELSQFLDKSIKTKSSGEFILLFGFTTGFLLQICRLILSNKQLPIQVNSTKATLGNFRLMSNRVIPVLLIFLTGWLSLTIFLLVQPLMSLSNKSLSATQIGLLALLVIVIESLGGFFLIHKMLKFRTCFYQADLSAACLEFAVFPNCNFSQANLQFANLRGGFFHGCNFKNANLSYADLTGADLRAANLQGANLHGAIGVTTPHTSPTG